MTPRRTYETSNKLQQLHMPIPLMLAGHDVLIVSLVVPLLKRSAALLGAASALRRAAELKRNETEVGFQAEVDLANGLVAVVRHKPVLLQHLDVSEMAFDGVLLVHGRRPGSRVEEV